MSKVYVVNRSGHDHRPARTFGPLIYLTTSRQNPYQTNTIFRRIADILDKSNADDYILMTGLAILNGIAMSCMAYKHGCVNLLLWDHQRQEYTDRHLLLSELLDRGEEYGK